MASLMHLITILFLFERTSKLFHNDTGLDADRGILINDQRNDSQSFSFHLYTEQ
jgi:hypothetical protein